MAAIVNVNTHEDETLPSMRSYHAFVLAGLIFLQQVAIAADPPVQGANNEAEL